MSSAISSAIAAGTVAAERSANAAIPQPTTPASNASVDVVQISEAQRVSELYRQGQTVSQIASDLSLSVAAVNSYLELSIAA
jgi:DNA-binding NarL/FixJ family response regulator